MKNKKILSMVSVLLAATMVFAEAGGGGEMPSPFSPEPSPSLLSPSQVPALPWSFLLCLRPRHGFFPLNDHRSFYLNYHFSHTLLFMIVVYVSGSYRVEL